MEIFNERSRGASGVRLEKLLAAVRVCVAVKLTLKELVFYSYQLGVSAIFSCCLGFVCFMSGHWD